MTVSDLRVGPPGKPDQPPASSPAPREPERVDAELLDDADQGPPPVSHETVRGLVLGAANIAHQIFLARYPEKPEIAVMTDREADQIAGALVSMSARNEALRQVLERADVATLALVLSGYTGRVVADIGDVKRERAANERANAGTDPRHPGTPGAPRPGVGGVAGSGGHSGSDGGGLRPAIG